MLADVPPIPARVDYPDDAVRASGRARLERDDTTHALEQSAIGLEVHDSEVFLFGHAANSEQRLHMAEGAKGVASVKAVHDALVADTDLKTDAAQTLPGDPRTGAYVIRVGASQGWIILGGEVPDLEARAIVEKVAARVSHGRGVLAPPQLPQEPKYREANGRPLQPRLDEAVHANAGPAGHVAQVVIRPQSRLVSHIVVAADVEVERWAICGQRVIPATARYWMQTP